jgi:ribosome-binding factor A
VARGTRMRRVNAVILQAVAEGIAELADPRLGLVTVTAADATTDLKEAKVYYTVLEQSRRRASQDALDSARGVLQARVGGALQARNTPQIRFVYDEAQERAIALTRLIDEVAPAQEGESSPAPEASSDRAHRGGGGSSSAEE